MSWAELVNTVGGGVGVVALTAMAREAWTRRRVPAGMSRPVQRRSYLSAVLALSRQDHVHRLEALVPNLRPARGTDVVKAMQAAWAGINERRGARLVTGDSQDNLAAGAELLSKGVQVRVMRSLRKDLSYHIFTGSTSHVVVNHRDGDSDRPSRMDGLAPAKIFLSHFEGAWQSAVPLESVLAEQVLETMDPNAGRDDLAEQLRDLRNKYNLDATATEAVLRHIAFLHSARFIFITGLPGAGKSVIRRRLADRLTGLRFHVDEQSDYVYAFCDFLRHMIRLDEGPAVFTPDAGGAFRVDDERHLEPALQTLAHHVWANTGRTPITLVEFARSDMISALKVFEGVLPRARVIYVRASAPLRTLRLEARAQPPRTQISSAEIKVLVSDNHRLPSTVARSIYVSDNFDQLVREPALRGRVHQLDNELEDPNYVGLDEKLDGLVEEIVRPYRGLSAA